MTKERLYIRYPLPLPVRLETMEPDRKEVLDLETRDISYTGTFIPTITSFPEGTRVKLDFTIPSNKFRKLKDIERLKSFTGRVVRTEPYGIAIHFDQGCQIDSLKVL
jgi:hypothetical protein